MIISNRISEIYDSFQTELMLLEEEISPMLEMIASNYDGFFDSRVKSKESFAQKVETGLFTDPNKIIDLYAATIVVPTNKDVHSVEKELEKDFGVIKKIENRKKSPSDFQYDDIHLHVQFKPKILIPGKEYLQRSFELQLKTFLQHGWAKATHDILYKGQTFSWPRFRVASQIKAVLEQSDQILADIDKAIDMCPDNEYVEFVEKKEISKIVTARWDSELLPLNTNGLVNEIYNLLVVCKKDVDYLDGELKSGKYNDILSAKSITPYQSILGILIKNASDSLCKGLKYNDKKIYISNELKDMIISVPKEIMELTISF